MDVMAFFFFERMVSGENFFQCSKWDLEFPGFTFWLFLKMDTTFALLQSCETTWSPWAFKNKKDQLCKDVGQLSLCSWIEPGGSHGLVCVEFSQVIPNWVLMDCWLISMASFTNHRGMVDLGEDWGKDDIYLCLLLLNHLPCSAVYVFLVQPYSWFSTSSLQWDIAFQWNHCKLINLYWKTNECEDL